MASVWFDGIEELTRLAVDIGTSPERVGAKASAVLRKSVLDGEAAAKQLAAVDTGFMRGSVTHEFRGDGRHGSMEGEWGPEASYAGFVEFGTERTAPQPFVGPSFDRVVPPFLAALGQVNNPLD